MKKAIGIICGILGGLAVVGGALAIIFHVKNKAPKEPMELPEELKDYAERHLKFGGNSI